MNSELSTTNRERIVKTLNGWVVLPLVILLFFGALALLIFAIVAGVRGEGHPIWSLFVVSLLLEAASIVMLVGFFTLQPNEARVLILFGAYKGTVRDAGFHWGNPFYSNGPSQLGALARTIEARKRGGADNAALDMGHAGLIGAGLTIGARAIVGAGGREHEAIVVQTFADAAEGELLVYEDAWGSAAIAVNRGDAAAELSLAVDDEVRLRPLR